MKTVFILGSTGSLGSKVFDYLSNQDCYSIEVITGWRNVSLLKQQASKAGARYYHIKNSIMIWEALKINSYDIIVNCIEGRPGIELSYLSLNRCKTLVLGNKETLFIDGNRFLDCASVSGTTVVPLDSELTSIWWLWKNKLLQEKIILLASGGVLKDCKDINEIDDLDVLNHPTWSMGKQITVNSTTMVNKIYEYVAMVRYFKIDKEKVITYITKRSNIHAATTNDFKTFIIVKYPSDMIHPIKMIFSINYKPTIEKSDNSIFKKVSKTLYPVFIHRDDFLNKMKANKLLNISWFQTEIFLKKQISYQEMINRLIPN